MHDDVVPRVSSLMGDCVVPRALRLASPFPPSSSAGAPLRRMTERGCLQSGPEVGGIHARAQDIHCTVWRLPSRGGYHPHAHERGCSLANQGIALAILFGSIVLTAAEGANTGECTCCCRCRCCCWHDVLAALLPADWALPLQDHLHRITTKSSCLCHGLSYRELSILPPPALTLPSSHTHRSQPGPTTLRAC